MANRLPPPSQNDPRPYNPFQPCLAKPPGALGLEIREQIGGTAPTNPETMPLLAVVTRIPYRVDFAIPDVGKTVWFAFRWAGRNGKAGPWSDFYSQIIPG